MTETTEVERNWNRDLDEAPQDGTELLLLIPTGDPDMPLAADVGMWDQNMGQWAGPWRNSDGEGAYPHAEPIAWAYLPDYDDDIAKEYGIEFEEASPA